MGAYDQMRPIAEAYGLPPTGDPTLELELEGVKMIVSVDLNSGSVVGLTIELRTHALPEIELRRETETDIEGKDRGINRELQLGDSEFDPLVYIETHASDESVSGVLAEHRHRRAFLTLIEHCGHVYLGDRGVRVGAGTEYFEVERFRLLGDAMAELVSIPRVPLGPPMPESSRGVAVIALLVLLFLVSLGTVIIGFGLYPPLHWGLPVIGGVSGFVLWFSTRWLFARAVSGHATSFRRYRLAVVYAFFDFILLGVGLPVTLNGALDAPPVRRRTKITAVKPGDDVTHTKLAPFAAGEPEYDVTFNDASHTLSVGDTAEVAIGRGFLGFPWKSGEGQAWSGTH